MNDQCRLQYSETNGPYVTYDGSLAACQRVNQASHLWYPTGQAQRDAVIASMLSDAIPVTQNQRTCIVKTNIFNYCYN